MNIEGVKLIDLEQHLDDRGELYEVIHEYDLVMQRVRIPSEETSFEAGVLPILPMMNVVHYQALRKFGQTYVVKDRVRNTIRAFHRHEKTLDYFHIVQGSAKVVLVANLEKMKDQTVREFTEGELPKIDKVVLSSSKPQLLIIPPGIWHGWMSLEDNTTLISTASEVYNKDNPDEERLSPYALHGLAGNIWEIEVK